MIRAIIAGTFVSVLLAWLGVFVVSRRMSLIGDGIAHASLAGIALALLAGWAPMPTAIVLAIIIAIVIFWLEKKTNISNDMAIAIILTTGMAIGVVLLHFYQGYQPELISYLFGNILTINMPDLWTIIISTVIILAIVALKYRQLLFTTFDPTGAYLAGINPGRYDLMLYIVTAIAIILSIKIVGIVLVSALLVTPSAFSRLFAKSFKNFLTITISSSTLIVLIGLIASFYLDLPSGATIILTSTTVFIFGYLLKNILKIRNENKI